MLKLAWTALFGNPLYTLLGLGAVLLVSNGYVGLKAYEFGADREKVNCQVRINAITEKIEAANAKIKKQTEDYNKSLAAIEAEREAEARKADENEALANISIGEYQDDIGKRPDKCLPTDSDLKWLQ